MYLTVVARSLSLDVLCGCIANLRASVANVFLSGSCMTNVLGRALCALPTLGLRGFLSFRPCADPCTYSVHPVPCRRVAVVLWLK
jgi:hypothetical protein